MVSKRCHSRVNQTSVSRKGVLSLNIIVLADEFGVQDVRRPNKLNSEIRVVWRKDGRTTYECCGEADLLGTSQLHNQSEALEARAHGR